MKNSYGNVSTRSFRQSQSKFHGITWSEEAVCFSLAKLFCCMPEKWFWEFLNFFPHCRPNKWSIRESRSFGSLSASFVRLVDLFFLWLSYQVLLIWGPVPLFRFQCSLFLHYSCPLPPSFISPAIQCSYCLQSNTPSVLLLVVFSSAPSFPKPDFVFSRLQHDKPLVE